MSLLLALIIATSTQCPSEDATNCTWTASQQGNGSGHSFIDLNGQTYYLEAK